jgi:asparagine synthetase B (glutamine-hydrolysing)
VWRRDKKGFPTPVGNWLRDARGAAALELVRDPARRSRGLLDQAAIDAFARDHVENRADRSWQLWRALSLELWLDAFELA